MWLNKAIINFLAFLAFCVTALGGLYLEGLIFGILRYIPNIYQFYETSLDSHGPSFVKFSSL